MFITKNNRIDERAREKQSRSFACSRKQITFYVIDVSKKYIEDNKKLLVRD